MVAISSADVKWQLLLKPFNSPLYNLCWVGGLRSFVNPLSANTDTLWKGYDPVDVEVTMASKVNRKGDPA